MNLTDIRTRVARVSGLSTTVAGDLSLIDSWANEAVLQFLKDTKIHVRSASLALTADEGNYTLDSDILSFTDIYVAPSNGQPSHLLEPLDSGEILRRRLLSVTGSNQVMHYALQGAHTLMLYPSPAEGDTLHILYVPRPASALTAGGDSPAATAYGGIPTEYHPILEAYTKWKACEAEEHRPSQNGLQFQAEYERAIARVKADLNKKTGVLRQPARWGRRSKGFPVTPGTDIR